MTQLILVAQHLILLVHGLNGRLSNFEFTSDAIQAKFGADVAVLSPDVNLHCTHIGIGLQAERLYEFLAEALPRHPNAKYLSIIGHSLGGLVARRFAYVARQKRLIPDVLTPISLITVATPHLGSRHLGRIILGLPLIGVGCFVSQLCGAGTTGRELFLLDRKQQPLLVEMADDDHLDALRLFRRRVTYACAWHDPVVSFATAAIMSYNPFRKVAFKSSKTTMLDVDESMRESRDPGSELDSLEEVIRARLDSMEWRRRVFMPTRFIEGHLDIMVTETSRSEHGGVVVDDILSHLAVENTDQ